MQCDKTLAVARSGARILLEVAVLEMDGRRGCRQLTHIVDAAWIVVVRRAVADQLGDAEVARELTAGAAGVVVHVVQNVCNDMGGRRVLGAVHLRRQHKHLSMR